MNEDNDIYIDVGKLEYIRNRVPKADFIDSQYDRKSGAKLTDILFILSSPRCGSTFFADLCTKNDICIPHEYFQPYQYIPLMASRWGCIEDGLLDKAKYIDSLVNFRTSVNGWLGINLHGRHLKVFSNFEKLLPKVNMHYVWIMRRNSLAQAVSYEIASQTGKWSSHFDSFGDASYSFDSIKYRLDNIQKQNSLISAYLNVREKNFQTLYYEDLIFNPAGKMEDIFRGKYHAKITGDSELKKQSSGRNEEWLKRFSMEYFETEGLGYGELTPLSLKEKLQKFMQSIS